MSMESVLARLPGFLTGSAGRAIRPIEQVAESAAAHRPALEGLADGTLTAQQADDLFLGVADALSVDAAWNGIKAAQPALNDALGPERGAKVAHAIHGALSNLRTPIVDAKVAHRYAEEARLVADGSRDHAAYLARVRADASAQVGGNTPRIMQEAMFEEVLPQLEREAARTAGRRLVLGGAGAAIAATGAFAIARRGDAPAAPIGPGEEQPQPIFPQPAVAPELSALWNLHQDRVALTTT